MDLVGSPGGLRVLALTGFALATPCSNFCICWIPTCDNYLLLREAKRTRDNQNSKLIHIMLYKYKLYIYI